MTTAAPSKVWKLLDPLIDKLFGGELPAAGRWGVQVLYEGADPKDVEYVNMKRQMDKQDLVNHFSQGTASGIGPYKDANYKITKRLEGSVGVMLEDPDAHRCRIFCLDADEAEHMEYVPRFLKVLKKHNIECIYEYAGRNYDRAHIWVFLDADKKVLKLWVEQLLKEAEIDFRKTPKLELYGSHLGNRLIRFWGGHHLRAGYANPIKFRGIKSNDPLFHIQAGIDCTPVSQEQMMEVIGDTFINTTLDPAGILRTGGDSDLLSWNKQKKRSM